MKIDRSVKVAAFCRELGGDTVAKLASQHGMEEVYLRAVESLKAGGIGPELEADLDDLDALAIRELHQGLYPVARRTYTPPPRSVGTGAEARWWTCPRGWCAGQGRVQPGQATPSCVAAAKPLDAGPLPE